MKLISTCDIHGSPAWKTIRHGAFFSIYTENQKLFHAAFGIGNYLWTHAEIVQKWYDDNIVEQIQPSNINIACTLNRVFNGYYMPLFNVGKLRGGLYEEGGIFWADKRETEYDPLIGYHQIVGHTKTRSGILVSNHYGHETSVTWVDCLDSEIEFLKWKYKSNSTMFSTIKTASGTWIKIPGG
ncbi:MAG: hypothetical protein WCP32_01880 [Bacteroidota bacterium]